MGNWRVVLKALAGLAIGGFSGGVYDLLRNEAFSHKMPTLNDLYSAGAYGALLAVSFHFAKPPNSPPPAVPAAPTEVTKDISDPK